MSPHDIHTSVARGSGLEAIKKSHSSNACQLARLPVIQLDCAKNDLRTNTMQVICRTKECTQRASPTIYATEQRALVHRPCFTYVHLSKCWMHLAAASYSYTAVAMFPRQVPGRPGSDRIGPDRTGSGRTISDRIGLV